MTKDYELQDQENIPWTAWIPLIPEAEIYHQINIEITIDEAPPDPVTELKTCKNQGLKIKERQW